MRNPVLLLLNSTRIEARKSRLRWFATSSDINLKSNRGSRCRRGATTVEMAFVAPFVVLLVFASFEFSRMMMLKQSLTNAAREGCRHATLATTRDYQSAESYARDRLRGTIKNYQDSEVLKISTTPAFLNGTESGTPITVVLEVDCEDVSWLPPMFFSGAAIKATASMKRE